MLATIALAALLQLPGPQAPASPGEFVPGTTYDPAIPTIQSVVGHEVWEVVTPPDQVVRYFEVLAEAAPDRTHLVHYATSWEGRPLVIMVIGSPERIASLDEVEGRAGAPGPPRRAVGRRGRRAHRRAAGGNRAHAQHHGNEISPAGAAMMEAYHLLAAENDPDVDLIFAESLVLIDPIENPDGRNRFVQENTMAAAVRPNVEAYSAEHDERWPGGRVNHYLFDLNRDLFIQSQVETQGKVRIFLEYWPHIVADLHEMGGNAPISFRPRHPGEPLVRRAPDRADGRVRSRQRRGVRRAGLAYFNREVYDLFYPGYVDMWPMNHGALGMTYEQASARALVLEQSDGDVLTYGDGVLHQFTAAIATAHTSAVNRESILRDYLAFRREGIELGSQGVAEYVLHSAHDPGMAERLARMLVRNGIEVREASGPVSVAGRRLPAEGTFIVPMDQPTHRFARNLLDAHVPMAEDFLQEQIDRRSRREPDQIYDLTAWSQSLLWDVEAITVDQPTGAAGAAVTATREPEALALPEATVGYLLPWGTNAAGAVVEALSEGVRVRAAGGRFTLDGREFPMGTAIVRTTETDPICARRWGASPGPTGRRSSPSTAPT